MIRIIAAVGRSYELGKDNSLMWDLPGDMKFFRTMTAGSTVIMGRKTYDSIGRPLPKRRNIVVSRNPDLKIDGCEVYSSLEEAISASGNDAFIIGGAGIYELSLDYADELILTEIDSSYPDADVFFPTFERELYNKELIGENSDNGVSYDHVRYTKKKCRELLTINVKITGFEGVEATVDDEKISASMISFSASTSGEYFSGETVGHCVDTQKIKDGKWQLSARYMLKGKDYTGSDCSIFIENNGLSMDYCVPFLITDSVALSAWNKAVLRSKIVPTEDGVCVHINIYE